MIRDITLKSASSDGDILTKAVVKGFLAIHLLEGIYVITHVPTGMRVTTFVNRQVAFRAFKLLGELSCLNRQNIDNISYECKLEARKIILDLADEDDDEFGWEDDLVGLGELREKAKDRHYRRRRIEVRYRTDEARPVPV